jgi:hypothetical protein
MTREERIQERLSFVTCDFEESSLSAEEIINYMYTKDDMPDDVTLWEQLEYNSPRELVKDLFNDF